MNKEVTTNFLVPEPSQNSTRLASKTSPTSLTDTTSGEPDQNQTKCNDKGKTCNLPGKNVNVLSGQF